MNQPEDIVISGKDCIDVDDDEVKPNFFGIKNYLHNFYDHVSFKNPNDYDENGDDIPPTFANQRSIWWKIVFITGSVMLLVGAVMLAIGFTFVRMKIDIGYQEEMRIIDKSAYEFNECLDRIKVLGLVVFAIGGILVAICLVLPGFLLNQETDRQDESANLKLNIDTDDDDDDDDEEETRACVKNLIPVTEELEVIQPKLTSPTVITNSGLKQID